MSVTESDVMTLMGETQEATVGGRQADISAAIERQHAYEAGKAAEFGTAAELGPQFLATAVPLITGGIGLVGAFGGGGYVSPLEGNQLYWQQPPVIDVPNEPPPGPITQIGPIFTPEPMEQLPPSERPPLPRFPTGTNFPVPYEG